MYKNKHINMSPTSFSNVNIGNYKFNCYNSANTHGNSTANGSAKANPVAIASTNANMSSQLDDTQFRDKYF